MAEFEILTVTTNQDSGKGSLRWALEKTQEKPGKYEIIFKTPEGAKPSDVYKDTNYWIIRLETPLPHLETSEIYINYSDSKAIVIAPRKGEHPQLGHPNDSLLTIGSNKDSDAVVKLNNINFARHKVVGYDGRHGGGGGLGAGAGIIIAGDVSVLVENSVFQDLEAVGGKGGAVGLSEAERKDERIVSYSYLTDKTFRSVGGQSSSTALNQLVKGNNNGDGGVFGEGGGGDGGNGGFGAGGAAGGGVGGRNDWSYPLSAKDGKGDKGGQQLGGDGSPGREYGGNGAALGGSIAIFKSIDGKGAGPHTELRNVLFVNSKANADPLSGTVYTSKSKHGGWTQLTRKEYTIPEAKAVNTLFSNSKNPTIVSRLFTADNWSSKIEPVALEKIKDQGSTKPDFLGELIDENEARASSRKDRKRASETSPSEDIPLHYATSELYNPSLLRLIDPEIVNTSGISETSFITYSNETGNKIGVVADLDSPNSALKKLWEELLPDKEASIREEYKKKTSPRQIFETALIDGFKDYSSDILKGLIPPVPGTPLIGSITKNAYKLLFDNLYKNPVENIDALKKNEENRRKLATIISTRQNVGDISRSDIREYRTTPIIRNFTLGEDSVVIPYFGNTPPQVSVIKDNLSAQNRGISVSTGSNTSEPNKIVSIILSDKSEEELNQAQVSAADYIAQLLIKRDNNTSWILGRSIPQLYKQTTLNHTSGPAATTIQVSRKEGRIPLAEKMMTTTLSGNDQVLGTDGNEQIITQAGDDLIWPELGNDTINGGPGNDAVSYIGVRRPVRITSRTIRDSSNTYAELKSALASDGDNAKLLNSTLINIENIHAFGGSNVDFSSLPNPVSDDYQYYSATLGAGSTFEGSSYDDTLLIIFDSTYNDQNIDPFSLLTNADGGTGFDRILADFSGSAQRLSMTQEDGITNITNEDGDIVLSYSNFENIGITGSGTDDHFVLGDTDISKDISYDIQGGQGNDLIDIQNLNNGKSGIITLNGDEGDDIIIGNANNNRLYGGSGNDTITGGGGRDIINGGAGSDLLIGGRGRDKFIILADGGTNTIKDFDLDREKIVIEGYNGKITDLGISAYPVSGSNENTLISDSNGLQIIMMNIDSTDLINSDRSLDHWIRFL